MDTYRKIFYPLFDAWDYATSDARWNYRAEHYGKSTLKWRYYLQEKVELKIRDLQRKRDGPLEVRDFLEENKYRLTVFAFLERWMSVRQAQPILGNVDSNKGAIESIRRFNPATGVFKGALLNAAHFMFVHYHALHYANHSGFNYMFLAPLFELAFAPIDHIKTAYMNEIHNRGSLLDVIGRDMSTGYSTFWRGSMFRAFNTFFVAANVAAMANDSALQYLTYPAMLFAYPFLTFKTVAQSLQFSKLSNEFSQVEIENLAQNGFKARYRGFWIYAFQNTFLAITCSNLLSEDKVQDMYDELATEYPAQQKRYYWN
eukprot:CAMPEP_0114591534 /NCGR_PEP_ID=MMETSP0125-20121206/13552_1 /TAXON_ID=485358 ORGANISM="Aristerostoma sp., Strain ATCC 50986" /NCGR_SAMPLE_ID=MMETSP0125 /ASSEMBLY_ACC=CAM_ASM_000245 /LENGTH=314 /DNA_ID=CAMNT_0001789657 /DNA_START=73 /DNA_END=1017 /DNA_ORIENTATION=+